MHTENYMYHLGGNVHISTTLCVTTTPQHPELISATVDRDGVVATVLNLFLFLFFIFY